MKEIEEKMYAFFVEMLELDADKVKPEADLKEDIGMSSLDAVETRLFIQKTFGWQMSRDEIRNVTTFSELCSLIERNKQ